MTESTDWASALAILAAGLVLGTLFIVMLRRKKGSAGVASDSRFELEARRDLLVEQLRDEAVGAEERLRLERETAEVLRELDQAGATVAPVVVHRANPAVKGFLWGMASTVALAGLAFYVYVSADKKPEVGQPPTEQAAAVPGAQSEGLQQLEDAVRADPDNVNHRIALAKIYFDQENLMGTFEHTKAALAREPNEPRALTYNAIVRMAMGQNDEAKAMLEKSSKIEPKLLDTWVALASVRTNLGDAAGASAAIDAAIAAHPDQEARLREVLVAIRGRKQEKMPPSPHAAMPDPVAPVAPAGMTVAAAAPDASIHLTLSLASSAALKSGVVYVIARSEGASGHPVAVKRVDAQSFPLSVEIGTADAMMGGVFPATVRLEARLDSDGDAGTTETGDPKAIADGVPAGSKLAMKLE